MGVTGEEGTPSSPVLVLSPEGKGTEQSSPVLVLSVGYVGCSANYVTLKPIKFASKFL